MKSGSLLGRKRELAALDSVLAAEKRGAVLAVVGEPGIGKSALLAVARAAARAAGHTVLSGAGVESETHLPFGGVQQLLAPLQRHLTGLSSEQRDAVATALGLSDGTSPDIFLIAEAAFAMVSIERAERPVVIVVDDVQWLDPQSHQVLAFLAHRSVGAGICVVGAVRSGHAGPFVDGRFDQLRVSGLDDACAEAILAAHPGVLGTGDRARIRREAQGNPLALLELPHSWGHGPPVDGQPLSVSAKLEQAFAGRVSELPAASCDALLVAATGSSSDTAEILDAVSAFGACGSRAQLLGPAVLAGLIEEDLSRVTFRHPLVRSAVLQRESLTRRHAAHAALADVVADTYRRTWHRAWSIVGPDDDVADALVATVPDCLRRGARMAGVSSLDRAAHLTSSSVRRGHRLMQAADLAFEAGRADVVSRLLREAAQVDLSDLSEAHRTWLTEALNDDVRADSARVRALCVSARDAAALGDRDVALNLLLGAALRCWWADSGADDPLEIARVLDEMPDTEADPRHLAALSVAQPVLRGSDVAQSLASVAWEKVQDGDSLRVYGMAAYGLGDFVLATDLLDRAEASFRAEGRLGMLPVVLALQLQIRLHLGDWAGAVAAGQEVVTVSRETGQAVFAENNVLVEARGMALRGDWQAALEVMAAAEQEAARLRINDRICLAYQARGAALLSAGRPADAFACLRRQYDPADAGYHLRESFAGLALTAQAAVACHRIEEARVLVGALEPLTALTPSPLLRVNLLYAQAVLAPEELRAQRYQEAFAHDLSRWPWLRACLHLSYGQWSLASGSREAAVVSLTEAVAVFERIGASRWAQTARQMLGPHDQPIASPAAPDGHRS